MAGKTTYSHDKQKVQLGEAWESIQEVAGRTYGSMAAFNNGNHGNVAAMTLDSNSGGGQSQVRIENDIKEMQSLLPPLLDTTSTKNFLDNDEIKGESRNQKTYAT